MQGYIIASLQTRFADQIDILMSVKEKLCSFESALVAFDKEVAQNSAFLTEIGKRKQADQVDPDPKKHVYTAGSEVVARPYHIGTQVGDEQLWVLKEDNAALNKTIDEQQKFISWLKTESNQKTKTINLQKLLTAREDNLCKPENSDLKLDPSPSYVKHEKRQPYRKNFVDLGEQLKVVFGNHRSGWGYAVTNLSPINHKDGIYLDTFIERTFVWRTGLIVPTLRPWIGFIHVPPNVPDWFQAEQSNDVVFVTDAWKKSYSYCKGLYTLSEYHKKTLEKKIDVPINNLLHPTEVPDIKWQWEKFEKNSQRKIVQIGWWLRKLHAIFELPESDYKKVFSRVTKDHYLMKLFATERDIRKADGKFNESMYETAETIDYLPDKEYDRLISENIVFADLYDSSANNLIIECIVRNAPLLVNPLEAVVEYLGKDYPFYFTSYEEAIAKACDLDLVHRAHLYLKNLGIKKKLSGEYFLKSFKDSEIFRNL